MAGQRGFFDLDERYAALLAAGHPLEKLGGLIDFEIFPPALDAALQRSDGSRGGRPPLDAVMMFKMLIVQTLYGWSDAAGRVPDPRPPQLRTLPGARGWRQHTGRDDDLAFSRSSGPGGCDRDFVRPVRRSPQVAGLSGHGRADSGCQIISAPRQRMTDEERAVVREGGIPQACAAKPTRLAQKDVMRAGRSSGGAARRGRTASSWQRSPRPYSGTSHVSASTSATASSAPSQPAMRQVTTAGN